MIECQQLTKHYDDGGLHVDVLQAIDLQVNAGEQIAIVGRSGAGKSTFLHLLGGLDTPSTGKVLVKGQPISNLSQTKRGKLRNRYLGFVYQFHHLLPEFTALENVCMPLLIRGMSPSKAKIEAQHILDKLDMKARIQHKPAELSGGERQRVAMARALVTRPACVLADEPTGNLDKETAEQVFAAMLELNQELGTSLVIVTHDMDIAKRMQRIYSIQDKQLIDSVSNAL